MILLLFIAYAVATATVDSNATVAIDNMPWTQKDMDRAFGLPAHYVPSLRATDGAPVYWKGVSFLLGPDGWPHPSLFPAQDCILIGRSARDGGVSRSIALGADAAPADSAHPLALSVHPHGVTPFGLGITINGQARTIPLIRQRLSAHRGLNHPTLRLSARSAPDQVLHTGHTVVLPAHETLERGVTFTLINVSRRDNVVVSVHDGRVRLVLRYGMSCALKCIATDGSALDAWLVLGLAEVR